MMLVSVVGWLLVLAVVVVLLLAARRPDGFTVARSRTIRAPAAAIFPLIDDLRAHQRWSPFDRPDAKMRRHYSGAERGTGAIYEWDGGSSGSGRIEITASEPSARIVMQLSMRRPIRAENVVTFSLVETGGVTEVTWVMRGVAPFVAKVFHVFVDMDRMCGSAFETGLAELAKRVER
jgi:uncharacterized protein YndB with AHSA1/START domain